MSTQHAVVKLSASEQRYAKRAGKLLLVTSGLAIAGMKTQSLANLETTIVESFNSRVNQFDPMKADNDELFGEMPRESTVPRIKALMLASICGVKSVWQMYKNIKSEFTNHWKPYDKMTSGENDDDALENVRRNVWAYRANKGRKNKKPKKGGKAVLTETEVEEAPEVFPADAPEASPDNWPLEIIAYKSHRNHPGVLGKLSQETSSSTSSDNKENNGTTSMLLSRKQQRADESSATKKRKVELTTLLNEKSHATVETKVAQAKAAVMHAEALKDKNKLEFLKLALQYNLANAPELMNSFALTMFTPPTALPLVAVPVAAITVEASIVDMTANNIEVLVHDDTDDDAEIESD